jgi:hypothetical protein
MSPFLWSPFLWDADSSDYSGYPQAWRVTNVSLDTTNSVDAIGIETSSDLAVLTIADSWDWEDVQSHLTALQAKFNAYLEFIESGQIWESYPRAVGRRISIDLVSRFPLPKAAVDFLGEVTPIAGQLGIIVRHRTFSGSGSHT